MKIMKLFTAYALLLWVCLFECASVSKFMLYSIFVHMKELSQADLCVCVIFLKDMMVRIWVVFLKTSRGALRCWWTAGVCRSSQMRTRRRVTQCHMKSSTTTSLLELWVSEMYHTRWSVYFSDLCLDHFFAVLCWQDASIAHRFHTMREKHPQKFNSRYTLNWTYSVTCPGTATNSSTHNNIHHVF